MLTTPRPQIESGNFQLELVSIPIWQLVDRTANEFRLAAVKKKIHLEVLFGDDHQESDEESASKLTSLEHLSDELQTLVLVGDRVRVAQVLRNIISSKSVHERNLGSEVMVTVLLTNVFLF